MAVAEETLNHLHVEVPASLHERLKKRAIKEGRSVSEETRRAIRIRLGEPEEGDIDGGGA